MNCIIVDDEPVARKGMNRQYREVFEENQALITELKKILSR